MLHHSTMLDNLYHIVITRFNIPLGYGLHLNEHWLALRVQLLKHFLLPSLVAQTSQNYHWVVLLHKDTPDEIISLFEKIEKPKTSIIFFGEDLTMSQVIKGVDRFAICHKVSDFIVSQLGDKQPKPKWVVTTRIDSDDAVSKYMIKELQEQILRHNERAFYVFPSGCQGRWVPTAGVNSLRTDEIKLVSHPRSPFQTFAEPFQDLLDLKIVFCKEHTDTASEAPLLLIETDTPRWMVVTHGRNIGSIQKHKRHGADPVTFGPECCDDIDYFDDDSPFLPGTW